MSALLGRWFRRLPAILAAIALTDLAVAGLALAEKRTYQAATIVNTGVSSATTVSGAPADWFRAGVLIANIEEVLRARTVLDGTIRLLGLQTTPDRLTRRLSIARINQTDLIKITASAPGAKEAADLANAHVASFLQAWERMEGEGARMTLSFARDQLGKAAERLRSAEDRLKRFRSSALPEQRAATAQRAADLASQASEVERALAAARAGLGAAEGEISKRTREAGDGRLPAGGDIAMLTERLRRLERNLQEARAARDPEAPMLERQARQAKQELARAGVQAGAEPALADAMARRVALLVEIAQLESQLAGLRRERTSALAATQRAEADSVTYAELQREVALRDADYRALAERAGQASLQLAGAAHSPIRIVDPAVPPDKPASRKLPLKLALATLVAALAAGGFFHAGDALRQGKAAE